MMNAPAWPQTTLRRRFSRGGSSGGASCPSIVDFASCLHQLESMHARLCPRQVLGVRMGLHAAEVLGLEVPRRDKRLLVLVETDGCFADGVSVATGCWFGRRSLRLVDYGRVAATIVDTTTERAVRICADPRARVRAEACAPDAPNRWQAQLEGYKRMPDEELLCVQRVVLDRSLLKFLLGEAGVRVSCSACGEEILNRRELPGAAGPICRGCAMQPYYRLTPGNCEQVDTPGAAGTDAPPVSMPSAAGIRTTSV